jgi:F-type H+-transporting ATPase subunit b
VNDVKANLEAIAQSLGKRLAQFLRNLGGAVSAAMTAVTKASRAEPLLLDPKAPKFAGTNLTPLHWLLIAAGFTGAAAAIAVTLGFALLDNTRATIAPLKERTAMLAKRLDEAERTDTALAQSVAAAESTLANDASSLHAATAQIQRLQDALAAQAARQIIPPREATVPDLGPLEKRVAALENKQVAPEARLAEVSPPLKPASGGSHEETTFPPFDPANFTSLLIWLTLTFGLLYLLMSKIAVPRIETILNTRTHKISQDISEANVLRAKAEEAAAAHEKTIADAKAKAVALAQETHAKLNAETEAKRLALEVELNAKLAASEEQVLAMKAKAMGHVESIAGETAAAIVQHITGKPADQTAIAKAITTTLA